jgi:hypothetical protein
MLLFQTPARPEFQFVLTIRAIFKISGNLPNCAYVRTIMASADENADKKISSISCTILQLRLDEKKWVK